MEKSIKRNIILYFLSSISSFIGMFLMFYSMTWLTFTLTESPSSLGLVGFMLNIPYLFFSIYGVYLLISMTGRRS